MSHSSFFARALHRSTLVLASIATVACAGTGRNPTTSQDAEPSVAPVPTEVVGAAPTTPPAVSTVGTTLAPPTPTESSESTAPSSVESPAPVTTVFVNPFTDGEIASRLLLDPEEYGPGWQPLQFKSYEFDETIATSVPGCSAFIDTVFASDEPPNATAHRYFHAPPGRSAAMGQFVIVFPTEESAKTTFAALSNPVFVDECIHQYLDLTEFVTSGVYCCDPNVVATPPTLGTLNPPGDTLRADEVVFRTDPNQFWTDAAGEMHGPEVIDSATVRVGRTITMIETITVDEFGEAFVAEEQFHRAIAWIVDRARHALGGVEH